MQLHLHSSENVHSKVSVQALNLMLVFQVNCPGCLAYAFPLLEATAKKYPKLNAFALSTAFEDFEQNTFQHTQALIAEGALTLASSRYFQRLGHKKLPYEITVPVVMDWFMADAEAAQVLDDLLGRVGADEPLQPQVQQQIRNAYEQRIMPMIRTGRTFLNNQMQGTPSWYLFNDDLEVLASWFGHKDQAWLEATIETFL